MGNCKEGRGGKGVEGPKGGGGGGGGRRRRIRRRHSVPQGTVRCSVKIVDIFFFSLDIS